MNRIIHSYLETSEFASNPEQLRDAVVAVFGVRSTCQAVRAYAAFKARQSSIKH